MYNHLCIPIEHWPVPVGIPVKKFQCWTTWSHTFLKARHVLSSKTEIFIPVTRPLSIQTDPEMALWPRPYLLKNYRSHHPCRHKHSKKRLTDIATVIMESCNSIGQYVLFDWQAGSVYCQPVYIMCIAMVCHKCYVNFINENKTYMKLSKLTCCKPHHKWNVYTYIYIYTPTS